MPSRRVWIALVTFCSFTLTIGIAQYTFGVFTTELEREFHWTRAEVTSALSFFTLAGLAGLPTGWALERWGSRAVLVVALSMLATSQLLRPWMTELWQFYALTAVQFAALPGAALITGARLVGGWFTESRGRTMGLVAMGANFGGLIFSSLTSVLVDTFNWQTAYALYGVLFLALIPVVLVVIRDRTSAVVEGHVTGDPVGGVTLRAALRSRMLYITAAAMLLAQVTYQSVLPQIVPFLEDIGMQRSRAALGLSVVAAFGMGGKVAFGWFCERHPARYALIGSLTLQVVGLAILMTVPSPGVWLFVPVFGFGFGALGAIMPLLVQETFGLRAFGTIFGVINLIMLLAALIGPPLVGLSHDELGSYRPAFVAISMLFVAAAGLVSLTRPMKW